MLALPRTRIARYSLMPTTNLINRYLHTTFILQSCFFEYSRYYVSSLVDGRACITFVLFFNF